MIITLDSIAKKTGSDKSSDGHGYCDIYECYMSSIRDSFISLLELGYGGYDDPEKGGESAKMWRKYFTNADITVTDVHDKINIPDGVRFLKTSQDTSSLTSLFAPYDVIIDDASHINSLTIAAFKEHWKLLNVSGLYIIEDLHASYDKFYKDSNPEPLRGNTSMNFLSRLLHEVNSDFMPKIHRMGYDIDFIHFYRDLCVIKKK